MRKWILLVLVATLGAARGIVAQDNEIPPDVEELAFTGVTTNADWTPVIQEFAGVEMVLVPAGCFMMGSTEEQLEIIRGPDSSETLFADELPPTEICFDEPFWIDRYEVTFAAFQEFIDAGGYADRQYWTDAALNWFAYNIDFTEPVDYANAGFTDPQQPRVGISSYGVNAYALWRGCRIPTEAEWEYAARGPDSLIYPWGDTFVADNTTFLDVENPSVPVAPVGSYPGGVSWIGAQDMSSSVWEWVNSLYEPYPYNPDDGREDLTMPDDTEPGSFDKRRRVMRGGSFKMGDIFLHAAIRYGNSPGNVSLDFGFRCTRDY
jgi:formylglycine-generating enzyme required for sulfatase activity